MMIFTTIYEFILKQRSWFVEPSSGEPTNWFGATAHQEPNKGERTLKLCECKEASYKET